MTLEEIKIGIKVKPIPKSNYICSTPSDFLRKNGVIGIESYIINSNRIIVCEENPLVEGDFFFQKI